MKIAIFTDTYPPFINGVSTSAYNLVKTLKEHGHDVIVVTPRSDDGKLELIDGVIRVPGLELKKMYGYRITTFYSRKILKMLKDFGTEIIHNQTDIGVGQFARIASRQLHVPQVYTYHTAYEDYTYYVVHGLMDRIGKKAMRGYAKTVAKNCTEFITPSIKTKEYMRSVGSDIYINVVPTGIDFSLFDEKNIDKEKQKEFKKQHGIGENTKVFLLLGRVAKEKSMDYSIRGFAMFINKHPEVDAKLIVVGDGPQRNELEQLTHELGIDKYVDFIGKVPASEVPFYYHLADIYTSASITETQGLTFMEAMASGTIVLARFDTNLSDTITDGQTGFFFTDENSFVEKAERIFALSDEGRKKIIDQAFETVDKYSISKFYDNIMEVYNRALKKFW
jgi:1,2-diacylglycerol 3-alpha-glucosyltransferase